MSKRSFIIYALVFVVLLLEYIRHQTCLLLVLLCGIKLYGIRIHNSQSAWRFKFDRLNAFDFQIVNISGKATRNLLQSMNTGIPFPIITV